MSSLWKKFVDDVEGEGGADRKLLASTTIIVITAGKEFGEEEKKSSGTTYSKNKRAVRIHNIRKEIKELKSQYKKARDEDHIDLAQLTS